MRSYFEDPPHALVATRLVIPMHFYMFVALDSWTYVEATINPFSKVIMQEEYNSLLKNQTLDLVMLPSHRNIFRCRWVYRTKNITNG
jgi:hypothetical protein